MLKGINKQIIEIKCPNSEHFEKILLFIKNDNGYVPVAHLGAEIYEYYSNLMANEDCKVNKKIARKKSKIKEMLIIFSFLLSGMLGLLAVMLIL